MIHFRTALFAIGVACGSVSASAYADTSSAAINGSEEVVELFFSAAKIANVEVLQQFLGKAITGLGGGRKKMYVIEGM